MIYSTRYGACASCRYRYRSDEDRESPCFYCCHNKTDNYEEDRDDSEVKNDENNKK